MLWYQKIQNRDKNNSINNSIIQILEQSEIFYLQTLNVRNKKYLNPRKRAKLLTSDFEDTPDRLKS